MHKPRLGAEHTKERLGACATETRVLLLGLESFSARPGGLNRYFADLHAALQQTGTPCTALVIAQKEGAAGMVAPAIFGWPLPCRLFRLWILATHLGKDADVVDAHFALHAFLPVVLGGLGRHPLLVHFQGPWATESQKIGEGTIPVALKWWIERRVYRRATNIVVLSEEFKQTLVTRYQIQPWRIHVVAPGVDTDRFRPGAREAARLGLEIEPEAWVALSVRRLVPRMGIDVLLKAWQQVANKCTSAPLVLLVAGHGQERAKLEEKAEQLEISHCVRFLGQVDEATLLACYQAADVSVIPSVALEGFGLVALESLACGTPVVASNIGGLPMAVGELSCGLLVPPGNVQALSDRLVGAIDGLVPLPNREACRQHSLNFSWSKVARRHRDLYEQTRFPGNRRFRVVFVGHTAKLSGGELALLRSVESLTNTVDLHVILGEDGPLVERLRQVGVSVEVFPLGVSTRDLRKDSVRPSSPAFKSAGLAAIHAFRLNGKLRQLQPDLVHTNTLKSAMYGGLAARFAGTPCIWHIRDMISPDYLPAAAVHLVRLSSHILPRHIVANSETTRSHIDRRGKKSTVIASPITLPENVKRVEHSGQPMHFIMVGRLASWKGQHVFLRAFAAAFPDGVERASIVGGALFGEDEYAVSLMNLANELGVSDRVSFRGFQEDVGHELATADVLVHASVSPEPFGQVVIQGMAAGLAVIASNAGGPAEVITNLENGILVVPGDVDELASAMVALAGDMPLRRRLGEAGRATASRYTAEIIAREMLSVYEAVLGRKGP